ncbi:Na/Pi cotransporter family protein [Natroniella sulfidigena]|uniref:Na/Pi cotransporter family protein n=1 Tax=Natroniella sulfidigena TaxID=723921 RepID=UPI00200A5CC4|nr:Na/Pi cotransporter family protein [Natroniella sulfidigena]MCK8816247.1 Na/Pi cotransporter family protein [Natroniella sulfidigena]
MSAEMIFTFLGGLGLFIYGMMQMSEGLQKTAGKKLKSLLAALTTNRVMGVLVGAGVTSIVQSSSATSVMVVGFVNAGLMNLVQSIGVIMGANVGTTITAQMVAFDLGEYAFHFIALGFFVHLFAKKPKVKYIGQVLLGFGILFLGMNVMSDTMRPLRDSPVFFDLMERFADYPILGVLIGALITVAVQSSTAAMGILLGLFAVEAISFQAGIPIILGSNIGTTVTAILSAIGASINAKRAAAGHFIFNVLGSVVVLILLYIIPNFAAAIEVLLINFSETFGFTTTPTRLVANAHTIFNILNTLLWLPFVGFMVRAVKYIVPGEDMSLKRGLSYLDERMLETPSVAVNQLSNEVIRMFEIARDMVNDSADAFLTKDIELAKAVKCKEDIINELEEELLIFLTRIPQAKLSKGDVQMIDMYFAMIDAIESIADDADELSELVLHDLNNQIVFSEEARQSLKESFLIIFNLLEKTIVLLKEENLELVDEILATESKMDQLELKYRDKHLERLSQDVCIPSAGIIYLEVLDSLEHISDQTADIALTLKEAKEMEEEVI